jgi:YqaJ-like viral recombinase domain
MSNNNNNNTHHIGIQTNPEDIPSNGRADAGTTKLCRQTDCREEDLRSVCDETSDESSTVVSLESPEPIADHILLELETSISEEIDEYVKSNIAQYHKPTFHDDLIEFIVDSTYDGLLLSEVIQEASEANREAIYEIVADLAHQYFYQMVIYPPRSYSQHTKVSNIDIDVDILRAQIAALRQHVLPDQRTEEWYRARYNMLTASNIYKALGSDAQYNSLVCEKCKPLLLGSDQPTYVNTNLSTHWGTKYEPLSVEIYQLMQLHEEARSLPQQSGCLHNFVVQASGQQPGCKVDTTFGCIPHREYGFLGASPDGIVVEGSRLGHMLEIKNSVSRELTGIPTLAYWVQCQVQMEVCELPYCDLFETSFKEFPNEDAFYDESNVEYDYKGVILFFVDRNVQGVPIYEYMPVIRSDTTDTDTPEDTIRHRVQSWIQTTKEAAKTKGRVLVEIQYWYLEEAVLTVIPRNQEWFQAVLPTFTKLWETVERERGSGEWSSRLPAKKTPKEDGGSTKGTDTKNPSIGLVIKLDA